MIPCSETACTEQITFSFRDESGRYCGSSRCRISNFDSPWTWVEDYVYRYGVLLAAERAPALGTLCTSRFRDAVKNAVVCDTISTLNRGDESGQTANIRWSGLEAEG